MSYDISVGSMSLNYTSNVVPMWDDAMPHLNLRDMDGELGMRCIPYLNDGIRTMARNVDKYRRMEPANEWGSYEGALSVLVRLITACEDNPHSTVHVHY